MDILAFLGVIGLFLVVMRLSARIGELESRLNDRQQSRVVAPTIPTQAPAPLSGIPQAALAVPMPIPPKPSSPDSAELFLTWLQTDWLLKLGAGLILIGFGWLVTYAFLNNWVGPEGRIAIGLVAGSAIVLFGGWRMRAYLTQGSIFVSLGLTTILVSTYAARFLYGFFTPASALALMFTATAVVAVLSVMYHAKALALLSLVMAFVAPLLTHSQVPDYLGLFWYLLIVTVGMMCVALVTEWGELTFTALIGVLIYSLPHFLNVGGGEIGAGVLLLFAYAFAGIFFVTVLISFLKTKEGQNGVDVLTTAVNGLFLLGWIWAAVTSDMQSAMYGMWAVIFLGGAVGVYLFTKRLDALYTFAGVGVALIAAATAAQFHGAALTIAYSLESAAVCICAYAVSRKIDTVRFASFLMLGPALLSLQSMLSSAWSLGPINQDFFVLLLVGGSFMFLGAFFSQVPEKKEASGLYSVYFIAGSYYWFILLWLALHAGQAAGDMATFFALVVYTIIGVFCYAYGNWQGVSGLRAYGGSLLGFVVVRLLLVDIWTMALNGRIVTFFLIGALLVSTAFMGKKAAVPPLTPTA